MLRPEESRSKKWTSFPPVEMKATSYLAAQLKSTFSAATAPQAIRYHRTKRLEHRVPVFDTPSHVYSAAGRVVSAISDGVDNTVSPIEPSWTQESLTVANRPCMNEF